MQVDSIIFDLDGTLWDTCDSCAVAWNDVVTRHGIRFRPIVGDDVRGVAGKPHSDCIREVFHGLPHEQIDLLIRDTLVEDTRVISRLGGVLYPGVREGLAALYGRLPLFIVSNCQRGYIETFYEVSGLGALIRDQECWGNTGRPKTENIRAVVERNGLQRPIYVGDTLGDQRAARDAGLPFAYAAYGFGKCTDFDLQLADFSEVLGLV
ncbi:MAG TPA: HAD family hydrolase [Bdellovibrionota bacterium]|jgi:phosphoglycolate phosphatase|nr:HAD family hydrolase [Bdellovibrionota bacterium]